MPSVAGWPKPHNIYVLNGIWYCLLLVSDSIQVKTEPMTPPPSDTSSPHLSPMSSSSDIGSPELCEEEAMESNFSFDDDDDFKSEPYSPSGLLDRTRLGLCVFMFCFLTLDPFGILVNSFGSSGASFERQHGHGRTILAEEGMLSSLLLKFCGGFCWFFF